MQLFNTYKLPIIGGLIGLLIALLLITVGILKTLLLVIFVSLGAGVGWFLHRTRLLESLFNHHKK